MRALVLVAMMVCGACSSSSKDTTTTAPSAPTNVHVDRRVELMSIVCALAGFKEYTMGQANPYRTEVVQYFRSFVDHPAVRRARKLRTEKGIGYDAPMSLAVHLDDKLQLVNAGELPSLDRRWDGVDAEAYAADLRAFAADTKLDEFLAAHGDHYKKLEAGLRTAADAEQPAAWYDAMFGARDRATYTVVPGPMTGTYNFGVRATRPDGTRDLYQIIGVDTPTGLPVVDDRMVYLLVHELGHSYINPELAQREAELARPAQKLYARVQDQMQKQAYGAWQIFLNEQVVRAAGVVYLGDKKGAAAAATALEREKTLGFLWTAEVGDLLRQHKRDYVAYLPALLDQLGQR